MMVATAVEQVDAYRIELINALQGQNPQACKAREGSVVLVFPNAGTLTLQLHRTRVDVLDGGHSRPDLPTVLVRGDLTRWLSYCANPDEGSSGVDVYGDATLLADLARLISKRRGPLSIRFGL